MVRASSNCFVCRLGESLADMPQSVFVPMPAQPSRSRRPHGERVIQTQTTLASDEARRWRICDTNRSIPQWPIARLLRAALPS